MLHQCDKAMMEVSKSKFHQCLQKHYEHWQKCLAAEGNYFNENIIMYSFMK